MNQDTPTSKPYVNHGPVDWVSVSLSTPYGATEPALAMELQCEDCEQVYTVHWPVSELSAAATALIEQARWHDDDGDDKRGLSYQDVLDIYAQLPERDHTSRDCIRFLRDIALGRDRFQVQSVETEDW